MVTKSIDIYFYCKVLTRLVYTVSDGALIFPTPILSQLQGWRWCQKIQKNVLQINLLSFCARIEQKLSKLQKIIKIEEKVIKNLCFLLLFWNLCNLRPQWLLLGIFVQNVFETNLNFRYQQVKN